MDVKDLNLLMRFKRQPRVLGTLCRYVPSNTLLHNKKLEYGHKVRIVGHPENENDLFVNVIEISNFRRQEKDNTYVVSKEFIDQQGFNEELICSVIWKDLAK
jgi:hypothetical protein